MLANSRAVGHTFNLLKYAEKKAVDGVVYSDNLPYDCLDNSKKIAEEFIEIKGDRIKNKCLRFEISPRKEESENFKNEDWQKISELFVKEMKLDNHQIVGYIHDDANVPHLHLIVNRVSLDGQVYDDKYIGLKGMKACENVSKQMGFKLVERHPMSLKENISEIHAIVLKELSLSGPVSTLEAYQKQMSKHGVDAVYRRRKNNEVYGIIFNMAGKTVKASEVMYNGKRVSIKSLENSLKNLHIMALNPSRYETYKNDIKRYHEHVLKDPNVKDLESYQEALKKLKVDVVYHEREDGKKYGLSYKINGHSVKASDVMVNDQPMSLRHLNDQLFQNNIAYKKEKQKELYKTFRTGLNQSKTMKDLESYLSTGGIQLSFEKSCVLNHEGQSYDLGLLNKKFLGEAALHEVIKNLSDSDKTALHNQLEYTLLEKNTFQGFHLSLKEQGIEVKLKESGMYFCRGEEVYISRKDYKELKDELDPSKVQFITHHYSKTGLENYYGGLQKAMSFDLRDLLKIAKERSHGIESYKSQVEAFGIKIEKNKDDFKYTHHGVSYGKEELGSQFNEKALERYFSRKNEPIYKVAKELVHSSIKETLNQVRRSSRQKEENQSMGKDPWRGTFD